MFVRQLLDLFVIDALVFLAHVVFHEFVHASGEVQRVPMSKMPAVRQCHAQHRVARLQHRHIDSHVRGRARVSLYVGMLCAKELLRAIDRQLLNFVGIFTAAVVAFAGIALGVFVRKDGAHGFEHRFGNKIFGGNKLQAGGLPLRFISQQFGDLRVDGIKRALHPGIRFSGHSILLKSARVRCAREIFQVNAASVLQPLFLLDHGDLLDASGVTSA